MTDEEGVQTLVDAGILNPDLSVAEPYTAVFTDMTEEEIAEMEAEEAALAQTPES